MYNDKQKTLLTGTVSMNDIPKDTEVSNNIQITINPYKNVGLGISFDDSSISDISVANAQINGLGYEKELQRRNMQENQNQKEAIRREQQRLKYQQLQGSNSDNSNLMKINVRKQGNSPLDKSSLLKAAKENRIKMQNRADLLYGGISITENINNQESQIKKPDTPQIDIQIHKNESELPDISNPDKIFFSDGLLSEKPILKEFDLTEFKDDIAAAGRQAQKVLIDVDLLSRLFLLGVKITVSELYDYIFNDNEIAGTIDQIVYRLLGPREYFLYKMELLVEILKNRFSSLENIFEYVPNKIVETLLEKYMNGDGFSLLVASLFWGEDAANLTRLNSKGFNFNDNPRYYKHAEFFKSPDELPEKYRDIVKEKLKSQNMPADSKGVVFYNNSILANSIINSREFRNFIDDNVSTAIVDETNNALSIGFKNTNLYYGIRKADIKNLKLDSKNNLVGDLIDTTDYNKNDQNKLVQGARVLQEDGKIEPKFIIVNFEVPPLKLREILKNKEK